jgi:ATP-binding cassette subfamily C protein
MTPSDLARGERELASARHGLGPLLWPVGLFSCLVNLLVLTSPLYMLQVYDRVLGSHSEATLVALSVVVLFLFLIMGVLDHARSRVMAVAGARIQEQLDARVFDAALQRQLQRPGDPLALSAQQDLEAIQRLWASPVMLALFDLPWAPFFLLILFVFNTAMGFLAVGGGVFLALVTWLNQRQTKAPVAAANLRSLEAARRAELMKSEAETILSMGMRGAAFQRWMVLRGQALREHLRAGEIGGGYAAIGKTFRQILQSAILGLGAWAVLKGQITGGAMIAGSLLMGRALQPVEQLISQWAVVTRAREGKKRLAELLALVPVQPARTKLPRPDGQLDVQGLTVVPPGEQQAVLKGLSFRIEPGQALGVIGSSGAGKSSLARAITGVWLAASGKIRLGGAALDQFAPDDLGQHIGYLPQRVSLFEGTIAENIARLDPQAESARIIEAAQKANAHEMILRLPQGYDTRIAGAAHRLSGGQMQRLGLARALYGDPVLLVLDEPNSNLDNDGTLAVNAAIRAHKARGGAVITIAHRPAAIQECDLILMIEHGVARAFGPTEQVLKEVVKNHRDLRPVAVTGVPNLGATN